MMATAWMAMLATQCVSAEAATALKLFGHPFNFRSTKKRAASDPFRHESRRLGPGPAGRLTGIGVRVGIRVGVRIAIGVGVRIRIRIGVRIGVSIRVRIDEQTGIGQEAFVLRRTRHDCCNKGPDYDLAHVSPPRFGTTSASCHGSEPMSTDPLRESYRRRVGALFMKCALVSLWIPVFVAGCAPDLIGNGEVVPEERLAYGFTGIDVAEAIDVTVNGADDIAVTVYTDSNLMDWVLTEVDTGRLVIGIDPGYAIEPTELRVEVEMPTIDVVDHRGPGTLYGDFLVASALSVESRGTGEIRLSGSCGDLTLYTNGSSVVNLSGLTCDEVFVELAGDGEVTIFASGAVDGTMEGAVSLTILGDGIVDVREYGTGVLTVVTST